MAASKDKTVRRGVYLYIDGKEIRNDLQTVQKECRKLENDIRKMTIGSREYNETMAKINSLRGIIAQHRDELRQTEKQLQENRKEAKQSDSMFRKMADGFNNYMTMVMSFIAGLTGLFLSMKKAVNDYLSLDSVFSDVMKYTGMTRDQVLELNEDLRKMDTRTARTELNRLAGEAGKLGITGRKNLLDFVEAADIINVSLGEDLGEDAIKNIGKLATLFGDDKRMGLKQAMLSIGSVINYLGSTSSAAEGYLTEFMGRLAGVGKVAGLTVPKIAAYGAVLDQDMQKLEMSSTALQNIIMKLYQAPSEMAKLVGLNADNFAQTVKKDINEALLMLLERLHELGNMDVLAPLFKEMKLDGAGATAVLADLANNVQNIRKQQENANKAFAQGSSVVDEFNTKNNDLTAQMEKAKKVFQERVYDLGQKLLPLMSHMVSSSSMTVRALSMLVDIIIRYGDVLMVLSAGLLLAATRTRMIHTAMVAWHVVLKTGQALHIAYAGAMALLHRNVKLAATAFKGLSRVLKLSPWGLVLSAITAAITGLMAWRKHLAEAKSVTEEFYASILKERSELDILNAQLMRTNLSQAERSRLIAEFNNKYGEYLSNLLSEKSTVQDIKKAYGEAVIGMNDYYARKLLNQKSEKIYTDSAENEMKLLNNTMNGMDSLTKSQQARILGVVSKTVNSMMAKGGKYHKEDITNKIYENLREEMGSVEGLFANSVSNWNDYAHSLNPYIDAVAQRISKLNKVHNELQPFLRGINTTLTMDSTNTPDSSITPNTIKPLRTEGNGTAKDNTKVEVEELRYMQQMADLRQKYLNDKLMTHKDYNSQLEEIEIEHLKRMYELYEQDPKKQLELLSQIQQKMIAFREQSRDEEEKEEQRKADEAYNRHEKQYLLEFEQATRNHYRNMTSEKEYQQELDSIKKDFFQNVLDDILVTEEKKQEIIDEKNKDGLQKDKEVYEQKKNDARQMKNAVVGVFSQMGDAMADLFSGQIDNFGEYMKRILEITLDTIEQQLIAQKAAAIAEVSFKNITKKGLIGLAKAAGEIALITMIFETAKSALKFYDGGYTPEGPWDKPQGVVHSGEFVSNRFAVRNPNIRPVFDLIDYAQKNHTVGNLTGEDIAAVLPSATRTMTQRSNVSTSERKTEHNKDGAIIAMLARLADSNDRLVKRLEEPITAIATASGKNGFKKILDDYNRMLKNKQR